MIIYIFIIGIAIMLYTIGKGRNSQALHLMQLEGYDVELYKKWISENSSKIYSLGSIIPSEKSPLVYTERATRLSKMHEKIVMAAFFILSFLILISFNTGDFIKVILLAIASVLVYLFIPHLMILSTIVMKPKEESINMEFYHAAQDKIKSFQNLKVVGITGSFGKTSTKFITSTILREKLNVQDTPSSFNTPMGLSKIINNELDETKDVFIAELGAKKIGEIKEVAELVQPTIGLITSIGMTHMDSFLTIDNILKTKYELIDALQPDGKAVFNYDNNYLKRLADKTIKEKYLYGLEDVSKLDVYAKDVSVNSDGSTFTLVINGAGEIECKTSLLGKHNINNLLGGATIAHILGLSLEEIKSGIAKVEPIEHRLSLVKSPNGVTIIDDAFNSNPIGAKAALDVLDAFKTGKKLIVTPGMVELGDEEYEANKNFGRQIADVCDYVILVGKERTKPIFEGLVEKKFQQDKIFVVDSLNEATSVFGPLMQYGDVILFENDLPDNYS